MTDKTQIEALFSVWVGGAEINNFYLPREAAERVAKAWKDDGYKDATIRQEANFYLPREAAERITKYWKDYGYEHATIRQEAEKLECPNHEGKWDCSPFCRICEGEQEYENNEEREETK